MPSKFALTWRESTEMLKSVGIKLMAALASSEYLQTHMLRQQVLETLKQQAII